MNDTIEIRLDSEQADLIVRALHEFRERFYERSRMDNDLTNPRVRRALDVIDSLKMSIRSELIQIYNQKQRTT